MDLVVGFDEGSRVLRATLNGVLNEDTLDDLTVKIRGLLQHQLPYAIIVDVSGVTDFEISNQAVRSLARMPSNVTADFERIVIAPQNHIYGITRMFQAYADGNRPNVHVVRSLEEAYTYLNSRYPPKRSA